MELHIDQTPVLEMAVAAFAFRSAVSDHQNRYRFGTVTVTHVRIITTDCRYGLIVFHTRWMLMSDATC